MQHKFKSLDCRWDPNTDINSLGPLERNPSNPSRRTRERNRRLLEILLDTPTAWSIAQADKILAAYPYLRDQWGPRITAAVAGIEGELDKPWKSLSSVDKLRGPSKGLP